MATSHANDAMIRRLQAELDERNTHANGIIRAAQDEERDLNEAEKATLTNLRGRMAELQSQLDEVEATTSVARQTAERMQQLDNAIRTARSTGSTVVDYRSAGEFMVDAIAAQMGNRTARERLEVYERVADHQITSDNPGVIPTPVVGNVINFIDAARPIVSVLGVQPLTTGTFYRPRVTQSTAVARQTDGGSAEVKEKVELTSQKMTIERLTVNAETYGGYVNVSRQNIDWSSPQIFDIIVNDLAAQYAIVTEGVAADALATTQTTAVDYPLNPTADEITGALWEAAATAYTATKGQGRLVLAVAPDRLGAFAKLFAPVNPQSAQSTGFMASNFGQGVMGSVSGISLVMSSGLDEGEAFLFSTAAVEVWEQRVGTLSVVEPSVLGVQVAYAGYFATLVVEDGAVVPLVEGTA